MVGTDAKMCNGESKERDCRCDDLLKQRSRANGEAPFHCDDFEPLMGLVGGKGNGKVAALCPFTPNSRRENVDNTVIMTSSPLSSESPQSPSVVGFKATSHDDVLASSGCDESPRTPKKGVFDPFAPGPEELLLAPICKKVVTKSRSIVARRLDFEDVEDLPDVRDDAEGAETLSEKMLLDTVYETLLEAIVRKQMEEFLVGNHSSEMQNLTTPISSPRLTGIAETSPRAPMKAVVRKARNIDPSLCRKLEF